MVDVKPLTEEEMASWPTEVKVKLEEAFEDNRGSIQPLVDMDMKSCVLITSNPGAVRANHFHKTGWHFCYVVAGEIEYYHRKVGDTNPPEKVIAGPGEMIFTPPQVEHSMVFKVTSTFITMDRNSRIQEVYEADVVRIPPIEPQD